MVGGGRGSANARFFPPHEFFVVEVDQRGTGKSLPSVRDDVSHMALYKDITIAEMSADFEAVREHLGLETWLVFGGSWGSTLGLDYAERYPERCLGLIIRGIFLDTEAEFNAIYARKSFEGNPRRQAEFDTFFEPAAQLALRRGEPALDADDSQRFLRLYEDLITAGDRDAIWRFMAFEVNLDADPEDMIDPHTISDEESYRKAQSVAFFETRLFLNGTFEQPAELLERISHLSYSGGHVPTWVVQGTGDEICPEEFARSLVEGLRELGVLEEAHFVDAGHAAHSDGIGAALKLCVADFLSKQQRHQPLAKI